MVRDMGSESLRRSLRCLCTCPWPMRPRIRSTRSEWMTGGSNDWNTPAINLGPAIYQDWIKDWKIGIDGGVFQGRDRCQIFERGTSPKKKDLSMIIDHEGNLYNRFNIDNGWGMSPQLCWNVSSFEIDLTRADWHLTSSIKRLWPNGVRWCSCWKAIKISRIYRFTVSQHFSSWKPWKGQPGQSQAYLPDPNWSKVGGGSSPQFYILVIL
jgi:hypothetical protein